MKRFIAVLAISIAVSAAQAGSDFGDTDPVNDLPAGADAIGITSVDSAVTVASLAAGGDVDWYTIDLLPGETLSAITTPLEGLPGTLSTPDTLLGVFLPGPVFVNGNDDAGSDGIGGGGTGPTRGSAVRYHALFPTKILLAVSGFPDFAFTGAHGEFGRYALTVSVVPEPASLIGLALAGLLVARRR